MKRRTLIQGALTWPLAMVRSPSTGTGESLSDLRWACDLLWFSLLTVVLLFSISVGTAVHAS